MVIWEFLRRTKQFLIVAACSILVLEVILQCASLVLNHQMNRRMTASSSHVRGGAPSIKVLCVGDSYTQGVGASELKYSYPMQLQEALRQKSSLNWEVINNGKAGTNSSELVRFLPRLFEIHRPKYLVVLVGVNDSWNFEYADAQDPPASKSANVVPWKLRCRTCRLVFMVGKLFRDIQAGKENVQAQTSSMDQGVSPQEEGQQGLTIEQMITRGDSLSSARKLTEAAEVFEKIVRQYPAYENLIEVQIKLAETLAELKRMDEALSYALAAQKRIAGQTSLYHHGLAWLFMRLGKFDLAKSEIEQYEKMIPVSGEQINTVWGNYYFETYNYPEAEKCFLKALTPGNPLAPFAMRTLARIYSFDDSKLLEAKKLLMKAYAMDRNMQMTELYLGIVHSTPWDKFQRVLEQDTEVPGIDRQTHDEFVAISRTFARRHSVPGAYRADLAGTLQANLTAILELCSQYKVIPVLMTYPDHKEQNAVIRKFCAGNKIPLFDAEAKFAVLLKDKRFETYFVVDNHLNDQGYLVLAQELGALLMGLEASPFSLKQ